MTIATEPTATRSGRAAGRRHRSVAGLPPNIFPEGGVLELSEEEVARREAETPAGRSLVTGGNPDEPYPVPTVWKDFADAADLQDIGQALIAELDEFEELRAAMEEKDVTIRYFWRKKAAKQADRVKAGSLGKAGGLLKHVARGEYVVQVAADAAAGRTRWQIEALVFHELYHILVTMVWKGPKGAKVEVPQLKTRAHDLEMFWAEVERYGLWRRDLEHAEKVFTARQTRLSL